MRYGILILERAAAAVLMDRAAHTAAGGRLACGCRRMRGRAISIRMRLQIGRHPVTQGQQMQPETMTQFNPPTPPPLRCRLLLLLYILQSLFDLANPTTDLSIELFRSTTTAAC